MISWSQTKTPCVAIYPPFELNKPQTAPHPPPLSPRREVKSRREEKTLRRSVAQAFRGGLGKMKVMTCPDAQQKWHIDLRFLVDFCW